MLALWTLAGHRGCRLGFRFVICLREFVVHLLQEPILTSSLSNFGCQDGPLTPKLRAVQSESHEAVSERRRRVDSCRSDHVKFAVVPDDDFARAIFAVRECFLEQKIVERVVLNMNRETFYLGIFAWPLRNRPRDQSRANFQSEVVVETPTPVLLDHESEPWSSGPRSPFGDDCLGHGDGPDGALRFLRLLDSFHCNVAVLERTPSTVSLSFASGG